MANKKINELDSRASLSLSDLMAVGDPSTGYLYKTTISDLKTLTGAGVISFNGRFGAVVPVEGDYSLTQLSDVIITSASNGQVLKFNGSNWVNAAEAGETDTLDSVTGRGNTTANSITVGSVSAAGLSNLLGQLRTFATTGNVYIGANPGSATDAGFKLDVLGTTRLNGNTTVTGVLTGSDTIRSTNGTVTVSISYGSTAGIIGTTSNHSLEVRTNNVYRIGVNTSGVVNIANLTGTGSRIVVADAAGNLSASNALSGYVTLDTTQTISGAKTFSAIPVIDNGSSGMGLRFKMHASSSFGLNGFMDIAPVNNSGIVAFAFGVSSTATKLAYISAADLTDNTARTFTLPDASGTLALTSNLSSYLPLAGGTLTGALNGTSAVFSSTVQASAYRLTGMTAGSGALYWTSNRVTLANYNASGLVHIEANGGTGVATFGGATYNNDFVGTGRFTGALTTNTLTTGGITSEGNISVTNVEAGVSADFFSPYSGGGTALSFNYNSAGSVVWNNGGVKMSLSSAGALQVVSSVRAGASILGYTAGLSAYRTYTKAAQFEISSYQSVSGSPFTKTMDIVSNADSGVPSEIRFLTAESGGNPTTRMFISSGGNVGIGTSSPIFQCDVNASSYRAFRVQANDDLVMTFGSTVAGSQYWSMVTTSNGSGQGISNAFFIGRSTSNPSGLLTRDFTLSSTGAATFSNTATIKGVVVVGASGGYTTGDNNYINLGGSASADTFGAINMPFGDRMRLNSYHGFEFKTSNSTSSPLTMMTISISGETTFAVLGTGTVYSNGGRITNTNPSDINLKENIEDLEYGLNEILQLRPVSYNWKNDKINQGKQFGFIAQEVQEIMPDLVKDGEYLGLDKEAIFTILTNAIKEQQAQIESLKARLN